MLLSATVCAILLHASQDGTGSKTKLTDTRTQVQIVLELQPEMFPKSWREAPINAEAVPLAPTEVDRSRNLASAALSVYPSKVLKRDLIRVYVCRSIKFYGLEYGGTNSLDTVYLTNDGPDKGYSDAYVIGSFHHELSSIFLRNHPELIKEDAWTANNPDDFKYGAGGTEALRSGKASTKYNETLAESGFIAQYAQASFEEDFNMTVEGMFSGNPRFWQLVDAHSRFRAKVLLAIKFYSGLDPAFTESFFRSMIPSEKQL